MGASEINNAIITGTVAKAADRYAIDVMGIPSLTLMERASSFVAEYMISQFPGADVLIVCGTGNNGADGICIGKMLKRQGFDPLVIAAGNGWKGTWEFFSQLADYRRMGGRILLARDVKDELPKADVLVDAIFGIGLMRDVIGEYRELIEKMNRHPGRKISVDVPSGINADTGSKMGICFRADETFTFGRNKVGLILGDGAHAAGTVSVCDIGIPGEAYAAAENINL